MGRCFACSALLYGCLAMISSAAWGREWTDASGKFRVEAELVDVKEGAVRLKKPDGSVISVQLNLLSKADQDFIRQQQTAATGSLAAQARSVLKRHCHSCHGDAGTAEGGMDFVLNLKRLVDKQKVAPKEPDRSEIIKRIAAGEMPPEGAGSKPSAAEIETLRKWIVAGAASEPDAADRKFINHDEMVRSMLADVQQAAERDRRYLRYFTLTHLYNGRVPDDEMQTFRLALAKLLNSLSWERRLVQPKGVDPAQTIFRIDLRDLRWSDQQWDLLVSWYPYGVRLTTSDANTWYKATESSLPSLRADWFVAAASRPPLYHGLLGLPNNLAGLEQQLKIGFAQNVRQDRALRAGFSRSGISVSPRIIERHQTSDGACWISHDFSGSTGKRNFFTHPLAFEADGGEVIFNLPNGLQAYLLVDAKGNRLDKAPTTIVKDPKTLDGAVVNGLSCMRCHAAGIIPKTDEVRAHVLANSRLFPTDLADLKALYAEAADFQKATDADRERFRAALVQLGMTRISEAGEPIYNIARRFEEPLDVNLASAELGLPADRLLPEIEKQLALQRSLGALRVAGSAMPRDAFQEAFAASIRALKLGFVVTPTERVADAAATAPAADAGATPRTGKPAGGTTLGLVHHWKFDEKTGDIARDSVGRNNISTSGWAKDQPRWVEGKFGNALEFSEDEQKAYTASAISFDEYTIAFWLRVKYLDVLRKSGQQETRINPRIIAPLDGWEGLVVNNEFSRGVGFYHNHGKNELQDPTPPNTGEWEHYAVVLNLVGKTATIYRNGSEVCSGRCNEQKPKQRWVLGHNGDPNNHRSSLQGQIDDVRIYRRMLKREEIEQLAGVEAADK